MRTNYKIYQKDGIYFVTSSIIEFIPVFVDDVMFKILADSLDYCRKKKDLRLFAYVLMDNHFHLVVASQILPSIMKSLKRHTAFKIIEESKKRNNNWIINQFKLNKKKHKTNSEYQVWQEGYHPKQILDDKALKQKIEYIHNNPVRRGFVKAPEDWKYSSASNYMDMESVIEIDPIFI